MFVPRSTLSLVVAGLALSLTACSALTRPDEITIAPEPIAQEKVVVPEPVAAAPGMAAPPGAKQGGG